MKNIRIFLSENFQFLVVKFSIYLNKHDFVMHTFASHNHPLLMVSLVGYVLWLWLFLDIILASLYKFHDKYRKRATADIFLRSSLLAHQPLVGHVVLSPREREKKWEEGETDEVKGDLEIYFLHKNRCLLLLKYCFVQLLSFGHHSERRFYLVFYTKWNILFW